MGEPTQASPGFRFLSPLTETAPVQAPNGARVVDRGAMFFFGDSHTRQIQLALDGGRDRAGAPPAQGHDGSSSIDWTPPNGRFWPEMRGKLRPGAEIVVSLGTNDHGLPNANIRANFTAIVEAIRTSGARPTFILPPTTINPNEALNRNIRRAHDAVRQVLTELEVPFVELAGRDVAMNPGGSPRGVHPRIPGGYRQVSDIMRETITPANWPPR